jgi:hypothetical protein
VGKTKGVDDCSCKTKPLLVVNCFVLMRPSVNVNMSRSSEARDQGLPAYLYLGVDNGERLGDKCSETSHLVEFLLFAVARSFQNRVSSVCCSMEDHGKGKGAGQLPVHCTSTRDFRCRLSPVARRREIRRSSKLRALRAHVDRRTLIFTSPTYTPRRINSLV